jgi:hypothetical protein
LKKFLDNIPYPSLIIAAIILGLAPFSPEPHFVEKFKMLLSRSLNRPIDLFDLLFHLSPAILLLVKWLAGRRMSRHTEV